MSNAESKKNILRFVLVALAVIFAVAVIVLPRFLQKESEVNADNEAKILPFSDFYINYSNGDEISFSATLMKEEFEDVLEKKNIVLPKITRFLPEKVSLSCKAKVKDVSFGEGVCVSIISAKVNEIEIPKKLLSDIGEINLDFKRSLVYN